MINGFPSVRPPSDIYRSEPEVRQMARLTDRLRGDEELRFAALMLVVSVIILVAIIREARVDGD